jgi:hypothetical protein
VTPYPKAPASLGPGNSWLVFEKELDDALDVSAKAGDEVGARLDENKIRIFGAWRVNLTGFGARLPCVEELALLKSAEKRQFHPRQSV